MSGIPETLTNMRGIARFYRADTAYRIAGVRSAEGRPDVVMTVEALSDE